VESDNQYALTPKRTKRAAIADLPENVSVFAINKPTGVKWRVQLGKRFTGGRRVTHDVFSIQAAKKWIFSDAQKLKADPGSLLDLKARAGSTMFELSSAQINEAVAAFKRLKGIGMTLTEAIDYAIKHSRPDAGVISVAEAIEKALERKKSKSKSYKDNLGRRWRRFEKWLPSFFFSTSRRSALLHSSSSSFFRLSPESVARVQPCYWSNRMPIWPSRSEIAVTCLKRGVWLRRAPRGLYGTMTTYAPRISAAGKC
jgi:hypothetical protein